MNKLSKNFFNVNSVVAAKKLLGKHIVRKWKRFEVEGKIVEVEAYRGKNDPGSHAFRKKTARNTVMFGPPGYAYVYFCYGTHFLFNIVTEQKGKAGAVLIRAVEPVRGIDIMRKRRGCVSDKNLTNGPAKFTQAFNINKKLNGKSVAGSGLYLKNGVEKKITAKSSGRIGIKEGAGIKWRFYIKGNDFVSVK